MRKQVIALMVAFGLLVSSAVSQTVRQYEVVGSACFSDACVEVVDANPAVVTLHYVREGHAIAIGNQVFLNLGEMPCCCCVGCGGDPYDEGAGWFHGVHYSHVWLMPTYDGSNDDQILVVNRTTRVVGVESDFSVSSEKIYQMVHKSTMALVYQNGKLTSRIVNPKASQKYPKNSTVLLLHAA
jgi:hypothetical protein